MGYFPAKKIKNGLILLILVCFLGFFFTGFHDYLPTIQTIAANGITVIIDPGHGGIDGGVSRGEDLLEKDINLEIAKHLRSMLQKKGYGVKMTREIDKDVSDLSPTGRIVTAR